MESDEEKKLISQKDFKDKPSRVLTTVQRKSWGVQKSRLLVNPVRALSGFGVWRYRWNLEKRKLTIRMKEVAGYLELWGSSFKKIEGTFGSGVSSYFRFLRWLFLLNLAIFFLHFIFIVLPHIIFVTYAGPMEENPTGDTQNLSSTSSMYNLTSSSPSMSVKEATASVLLPHQLVEYCSSKYVVSDDESVIQLMLDFIQGTGWMEKTLLFYGVYVQRVVAIGASFDYNIPLAYLLVTFAYLITSIYLMINHTNLTLSEQIKGTFVGDKPAHRGFSNIVFASWDFSLTDATSAKVRETTIFNEIRSNLEEKRLLSRKLARTVGERWCLYLLRFLLNLFVIGSLGVAAFIIFYATQKSTAFKERPDYEQQHKLTQLLMEFLPSLVITNLNFLIPLIFTQLVKAEDYHPDFEIRITLARTVFLRLASIAVLLVTLYYQIKCNPSDQCQVGLPPACPQLRCWETYVGQNIYKLIIMNLAVNVGVVVFVETPIRFAALRCTNRLVRMVVEKREFNIPKNVLDLVYVQTLCWLGAFFAPLVPVMIVITFFAMFYLKKVTVLYNYQPAARPYRSSRSQVFFMLILIIAFLLSCIPIAYCIWKIPPSRGCGPFRDISHMYDVLVLAIATLPNPIQDVIHFVMSPACVIGILVILGILVYYYRAESKVKQGTVTVLKEQIKHENRDRQFLLRRLNEVTADKADISGQSMRHKSDIHHKQGDDDDAVNKAKTIDKGHPNYQTFADTSKSNVPLATPEEIP